MLIKNNINSEISLNLKDTKHEVIKINNKNTILSWLIIKDMLFYAKIWRQVRGYSSNNQRTHSNNKTQKRCKTIAMFRLQQFYRLFGKKRRDIFPSLILAEYNNRLWYIMWYFEWLQGKLLLFRLLIHGKNKVKFDPQLLSKNIVTGVKKIKKKKKHNAAKKKEILAVTIGLPILFSLYLYNYKNLYKLSYALIIPEESRRKMGKKGKKIKNKKKK